MSRTLTIPFKVNHQEEKLLDEKAKKFGMNRSEFIRYCLFEDQDFSDRKNTKKEANNAEKDAMKFAAYSFNLLLKIAEKTPNLKQDEIEGAIENSKKWLTRNGYKSEVGEGKNNEE